MDPSLNELVHGEMQAIQALLDDSENWSRAVQTRILELREGTEERVHEREISLNNDDLSSLLEIDRSFTEMYIDLEAEKTDESLIQDQLVDSADASAQENREGQLAMAGIHGNRLYMKLASGFRNYKNSALKDVKEKHLQFMDELDYVAITDQLKKKASVVQRLKDDLGSKRQVLDEMIAEEKMTAEEIREKYESEVVASRVETLTARIEDQKHEIERISQKHEEIKANVEITKTALAQTLHDLKQKEDKARKFGSKKKVSRVADDGSLIFDDHVDDEKDSKKELQNRYRSSLAKVESLLKENSLQAKKVIEKEQGIIKLRAEYDAVVNSQGYQAIQRLVAAITLREKKLEAAKDRVRYIRAELWKEFGVDEETLNTTTKDEILKSRHERIFRRKERWNKVIESLYNPSRSHDTGGDKNEIIHCPVRVFGNNDLVAVRKIASTLRSASVPGGTSIRNELISQKDRAIQSHTFDKAQNKNMNMNNNNSEQARRERYLKRKNGGVGSPAALTLLGLDKADNEDVSATMLQDFGFQAIVEQLGVLDNLLKDGSRKHIDAAKRAASSGDDAATARDTIRELVPEIKKMYRTVNAARKKTRWMDKGLKELRATRDDTRSKFLRMIDGRDDMPKTIYARGGEAEFLNRRIPDLMVEINTVKEAIEHEEALLEKNLKQRRKNKSSIPLNDDGDEDTNTAADTEKELAAPLLTAPSPTKTDSKTEVGASADNVGNDRVEYGQGAPQAHLAEEGLPEKEQPTTALVDTSTGVPLKSVTAIHVDVGRKRGRGATTQFQSISNSKQLASHSEEEAVARDAYLGMADELRHASLSGSGVNFTRRNLKPPGQDEQSPVRAEKSSQLRLATKVSSPSPPPGFMSKVPSMRSSASAISELSADPSDPFNQGLDDVSDWRLNTGYASEDSSYHVGGLRAPGPEGKAHGDTLLPVHIINLVVEDSPGLTVLPPNSPRSNNVAPKKPFRLQLTPKLANLHFGGHRTHEHDVQEGETMAALAKELPGFYTELQDAVMQGHNPRHWSIPTMPSTLPEDPPLLAHSRQNKKERLAMIRRTERLLERLDAEMKAKRAEKKKTKEAKQLREAARRKEEEDVGIFEDLDVDDDEDTAIVVVHEDDNDSDDDDSDLSDQKPKVIDVLNAMPQGNNSSWTDVGRSGQMREDFICSLVERYRVSSI